jgi:hypothetical protein
MAGTWLVQADRALDLRAAPVTDPLDHAVQAVRPCLRRSFDAELDAAQHQHRPLAPLGDADNYEHDGRRRQPAHERCQSETGKSEHEDAAVAADLPEPSAGDQQHRRREQVASDHQLQLRSGGAEIGVDFGVGDVDDRRVCLVHEQRREQYRQQPTRVGGRPS